jgi:hypothetical protein
MTQDDPSPGERTVAELDLLSTDDLRRQAFELAEHRRDVGFFWDLIRHLSPAEDIAGEDGSSGNITAGIADVAEMVREMFGHDLGDNEPLIRARFISYLRGK